jgi:hypothetical protein
VTRTPKNLPEIQDKRAEVVKLRAQGQTWDQIADATGYANGSGALKAWRRAIAQAPNLAVTEIRAAEAARLEQMDATLAGIIARPPAKTTAIGKTVTDPDTGETIRDMTVVVAALRERRQVGESYRRLTAADAAPSGVFLPEQYLTILAQVRVAQEQMASQAPAPPLTPLPPGYSALTPAQQAEAQMARYRAQVDAHRDVIQGEVVE